MPSISRTRPPTTDPDQLSLDLAIEHVPHIVRAGGLQEANSYPLVSHGPADDWKSCRRPVRVAWRGWEEIELRTPTSFPVLILDCDTPPLLYLSVAFGATVCPPNWIVSNPNLESEQHAHVVYCLARPVLRGDGMRLAPLQRLRRISEYYRAAYAADRGYVGALTHNPVHPKYCDSTTWWRDRPFTLTELAEPIPKGWHVPRRPTTPEGRNVTLFKKAMRHFGRPKNWEASMNLGDVHAWISMQNLGFQTPLDDKEVLSIAKSVSKISSRNLMSGQTQQNFSFIQAARGRKSGAARRPGSTEEAVPWVAEGISRRTWYDHKAGKHTGQRGRPKKSHSNQSR